MERHKIESAKIAEKKLKKVEKDLALLNNYDLNKCKFRFKIREKNSDKRTFRRLWVKKRKPLHEIDILKFEELYRILLTDKKNELEQYIKNL